MNQYTVRWNNKDLALAIKTSKTWKEVCLKLKMTDHSSNSKRLKKKASDLGISFEHFKWKHKYNPSMLKKAVEESFSYSDVLRKLGMNIYGSAYPILKREIKNQKLDTSHFLGRKIGFNKMVKNRPSVDITKYLIKDSSYSCGSSLKRRLLKKKLLKNKCYICGNNGIWLNKNLVLVLDHVNGIKNDHRIKNLRMLCPNCNSQQPTFCRQNKK